MSSLIDIEVNSHFVLFITSIMALLKHKLHCL